jgi:secondary thiamine-phosphate synthase enzyme
MQLVISTTKKRQVIDITEQVSDQLPSGNGIVSVFVRHTTAAITTADLDPGTDLDFLDFLEAIAPTVNWRHPHNPAHAPDHLLSSLIGPGVTVPFDGGELQLGTWQRIVLVELDGPRDRQVSITVIRND